MMFQFCPVTPPTEPEELVLETEPVLKLLEIVPLPLFVPAIPPTAPPELETVALDPELVTRPLF